MLRVTILRCPDDDESTTVDVLGYADILVRAYDHSWKSYVINLFDEAGELATTAQLDDDPSQSDVWELVARGLLSATVGIEMIPCRAA
jgi:hypothetical protein